jgi:hypothetical protein
MSCTTDTCGIGGWGGPLPGDPSNDIVFTATAAYGGIDLLWSYPTTNPYAVAYTTVFRSSSSSFASATKIAVVGSSYYFDKLTTVSNFFYWIQITSVNGTVLATVGPQAATSKLSIDEIIENLTSKIDSGLLATALRTKIDKIALLDTNLAAETANRLADNTSLTAVLAAVNSDITGVNTLVQSEIAARVSQNSAVVTQLNALATTVNGNTAAIVTEQTARSTAVSALASRVDVLYAASGGGSVTTASIIAAIDAETTARVDADSALATTLTSLIATNRSQSETALNASIASANSARVTGDTVLASSITSLQTTLNTKIGTDIGAAIQSERTVRVTAEGALGTRIDTLQSSLTTSNISLTALLNTEATTRANADGVLAGQITTAQTTLNGSIASVRTDLTASIGVTNGKVTDIGARYTAVVDVNGLVGGFGIYNNGTTVEAGFNVDTFWVGRTTNKVKPFIISQGVVYINEAAIGKLSANSIDTRGMVIRDATGNIIFGSGATASPASYMSVPSNWLNSNVSLGSLGYTGALNATYGAPAGSLVGGVEAVTLANASSAAVTAAQTALTYAYGAAVTANTAATSANTANQSIYAITADNSLSVVEKRDLLLVNKAINDEYSGISGQAASLSITTERTAYYDAYNGLFSYLNTLEPYYFAVSEPSPIVRADFQTAYSNYYFARQVVLNKIAAVAATRATWTSVTGSGKPQDNATYGAPAGTPVAGVDAATLVNNASTAITNAAAAQTAATAAASLATTAQTTANSASNAAATANTAIANIASDTVLSRGEKPRVKLEWDQISNERAGIVSQAQGLSITTELTGYTTAWTALSNYLAALSPSFADTTTDTTIVPDTFRAKFLDLYGTRQTLLNKIAAVTAAAASTAQGAANTATTLANTAQTAANSAAASASAAQTTANNAATAVATANAAITNISSDSVLSKGEKSALVLEWTKIAEERAGFVSQANGLGITTELANYTTAWDALSTYLVSLSPQWADTTSDTSINPVTFKANFSTLYSTRQTLLNKIAAVAATLANWDNVTGTNKPQDNATNGAIFGVNIGGWIDISNISTYIQSAAIGTAYIANGAITNAKIGTAAIGTANIIDGAISNAKIGTAAIQSANIVDLAVGTIKIAGEAITVPRTYSRSDTVSGNNATPVTMFSQTVDMGTSAGNLIMLWNGFGGYSSSTNVDIYLYIDGTQVGRCRSGDSRMDSQACNGFASVSAGTHTVEVKLVASPGFSITGQTLVLLGAKR